MRKNKERSEAPCQATDNNSCRRKSGKLDENKHRASRNTITVVKRICFCIEESIFCSVGENILIEFCIVFVFVVLPLST